MSTHAHQMLDVQDDQGQLSWYQFAEAFKQGFQGHGKEATVILDKTVGNAMDTVFLVGAMVCATVIMINFKEETIIVISGISAACNASILAASGFFTAKADKLLQLYNPSSCTSSCKETNDETQEVLVEDKSVADKPNEPDITTTATAAATNDKRETLQQE